MEDLESGNLRYTTVGKFLLDLKEEFGRRNDKTMKVAELKKVKQGSKIIEEFVQEFRRAARGSGYEERLLIEEFKEMIKRKLMEAEQFPRSI